MSNLGIMTALEIARCPKIKRIRFADPTPEKHVGNTDNDSCDDIRDLPTPT